MKKKIYKLLVLFIFPSFILGGCAKKEDIQGEWFAYSYQEQANVNIIIEKKEIIFYENGIEVTRNAYNITKTGFKNNISYMVATVEGVPNKVSFVFLDKNDKNEFFIFMLTNEDTPTAGIPQYKLNRTEYPDPNTGLTWN